MAEYIDRDMFLKIISHKPSSPTTDREDRLINGFISAVKNCPAADVRPVVRGHKVTHNRPIAGYWASGKLDGGWDGMEGRVWVEPIMDNPVDYCSECGKRLDDTFQNFCPNCGADMREEG